MFHRFRDRGQKARTKLRIVVKRRLWFSGGEGDGYEMNWMSWIKGWETDSEALEDLRGVGAAGGM